LNRLPLPALFVAALLLLAFAPALTAQAPAAPPAQVAPATQPASVEANRKALNDLFEEYWQAVMEHSPEFASTLGDKRYNDRIDDYSVKAENAWLEREESFMMRLAAIDEAGLTDQEKTSRELLLREFADDEEGAQFKEWEMPLNQMGGIYTAYPNLVGRTELYHGEGLRRLDRASARHSQGLRPGDHQYVHRHGRPSRAAALSAGQGAGAGESCWPLKLRRLRRWPRRSRNFPLPIKPAEQERIKAEMLDAIGKEVLPAYLRFARFLEVSYVPAGRAEPGVWALPDGAKYYAYQIRRETTTNLTAEQIHQIGLDEVKRDEAEMLVIAQKLGFADLKSFRASFKTNPKLHPASAMRSWRPIAAM
jgi:uncharacterized protein (DUF885 family)